MFAYLRGVSAWSNQAFVCGEYAAIGGEGCLIEENDGGDSPFSEVDVLSLAPNGGRLYGACTMLKNGQTFLAGYKYQPKAVMGPLGFPITLFFRESVVFRKSSVWKSLSVPNVQLPGVYTDNVLCGVSALYQRGWAVGYLQENPTYSPNTALDTQLILEWNGTSWTVPPLPGAGSSRLAGVAARSNSDAWAVGYQTDPVQNVVVSLVEQWNGNIWQKVPVPRYGAVKDELNAVSLSSDGRTWAAGSGYFQVSNQLISRPFVLYGSAGAWKIYPAPGRGFLWGISAASPTDVWAVGGIVKGSVTHPLIVHWNGSNWRHEVLPLFSPTATWAAFTSVWTVSGNDLWLAGATHQAGHFKSLVVHWKGKTRKRISSQ